MEGDVASGGSAPTLDAEAPSMQEDTSDAAFAKSHAELEAKETKKNAAYHEQSAAAAIVPSTQVCAQQQPYHTLPAGGGTWSPPNGQATREDVTPRTKLASTSLLQGALGFRVLAGSVVGQPARVADDPRCFELCLFKSSLFVWFAKCRRYFSSNGLDCLGILLLLH